MRLKKGWQFAHEFFLVHLRYIEKDVTRTLNMANIVSRGNRDLYLMEAKANEETFFRYCGGTPPGDEPPLE